jgi:hypothetical protein
MFATMVFVMDDTFEYKALCLGYRSFCTTGHSFASFHTGLFVGR